MSDKSETPRTVRLRTGTEVVNGITGETGPTYSEYVLLSDYQELQRELAAAKLLNSGHQRLAVQYRERAEKAEAERDALRGALQCAGIALNEIYCAYVSGARSERAFEKYSAIASKAAGACFAAIDRERQK